jgi:site-specific recombinase XerC
MAAEATGLGTLVSQHTLRHSFVARLCSCHGNLKPAGATAVSQRDVIDTT